uniref:Uncharacterized protein n=1 Tax=Chromera velia CCMP2878 TaxID=1169474 RepID=A0A0G4FPF6_9ALVE|eukprot:Cvel_18075.t1-p1 / transcript=Cvel_18075.t1 / gene=Cvel_18075 / organism=Chromera_velia_CCMP2878 / gene_product=hypothetical protein / transcript_product=hypothetical protein / location=Cvel_scaffold1478:23743-26104(+) / protein_length=678 / sequence_SO=supercontig / SO=protein_coding / is_pseudo=false
MEDLAKELWGEGGGELGKSATDGREGFSMTFELKKTDPTPDETNANQSASKPLTLEHELEKRYTSMRDVIHKSLTEMHHLVVSNMTISRQAPFLAQTRCDWNSRPDLKKTLKTDLLHDQMVMRFLTFVKAFFDEPKDVAPFLDSFFAEFEFESGYPDYKSPNAAAAANGRRTTEASKKAKKKREYLKKIRKTHSAAIPSASLTEPVEAVGEEAKEDGSVERTLRDSFSSEEEEASSSSEAEDGDSQEDASLSSKGNEGEDEDSSPVMQEMEKQTSDLTVRPSQIKADGGEASFLSPRDRSPLPREKESATSSAVTSPSGPTSRTQTPSTAAEGERERGKQKQKSTQRALSEMPPSIPSLSLLPSEEELNAMDRERERQTAAHPNEKEQGESLPFPSGPLLSDTAMPSPESPQTAGAAAVERQKGKAEAPASSSASSASARLSTETQREGKNSISQQNEAAAVATAAATAAPDGLTDSGNFLLSVGAPEVLAKPSALGGGGRVRRRKRDVGIQVGQSRSHSIVAPSGSSTAVRQGSRWPVFVFLGNCLRSVTRQRDLSRMVSALVSGLIVLVVLLLLPFALTSESSQQGIPFLVCVATIVAVFFGDRLRGLVEGLNGGSQGGSPRRASKEGSFLSPLALKPEASTGGGAKRRGGGGGNLRQRRGSKGSKKEKERETGER